MSVFLCYVKYMGSESRGGKRIHCEWKRSCGLKKIAILYGERIGRDDREFIIIIIIGIKIQIIFRNGSGCAFVGRGSMKYGYERSIVS